MSLFKAKLCPRAKSFKTLPIADPWQSLVGRLVGVRLVRRPTARPHAVSGSTAILLRLGPPPAKKRRLTGKCGMTP